MSDGPTGVSIEELLEQRGWVRALARSLSADGASADDLEQEAWLTAIRRPPSHASGLGGWFARVVRSRAADAGRAETSRRGRERATARPEALPSTEHLAQLAELQAKVARAVVELPEPLRSAILLRYFEELPLDAVAHRTGTTVDGVRGRLKKALGLLRDRLDAEHHGGRGAWLALLTPLLEHGDPSVSGGATKGGGRMSRRTRVTVATSGLVLLTGMVALLCRADSSSPPVVERAAAPVRPAGAPVPEPAPIPEPAVVVPLPAPAVEEPPPVPAPAPKEPAPAAPVVVPPTAPPVPPPVEPATIPFVGRVLDEARHPVASARVTVRLPDGSERTAVSGEGGRFEVRVPPLPASEIPGRSLLFFRAEAPDGRLASLGFPYRVLPEGFMRRLVLILSSPRSLEARVLDSRGPVEGAEVLLVGQGAVMGSARSDAAGRVRFGPFPRDLFLRSNVKEWEPLLLVARESSRGRGVLPVPCPMADGELTVRLAPAWGFTVEVVDAGTGMGIPGAHLEVRESFENEGGWTDTFPCRPSPGPDRTDSIGRAVFSGVGGKGKLSVAASADGYGGRGVGLALYPQPGDILRFQLRRASTVRWPVSDKKGVVPPDGSSIRLVTNAAPDPAAYPYIVETRYDLGIREGVGRIERDREGRSWLVVEGLGGGGSLGGRSPGYASLAVAPDGRMAWISAPGGKGEGPAISFEEPRSTVVEVLDGEGHPVQAVHVMFKGARRPIGGTTELYAVTDSQGRAILRGLHEGEAFVFLLDPSARSFAKGSEGKVDLSVDGAHLEARLPSRVRVDLLLRTVMDGEPRLPSRWSLLVMQGGEDQSWSSDLWGACEEDPEAGTIRLTAWLRKPEGAFSVNMNALDYWHGYPIAVPAGHRKSPIEVVIDLRPIMTPIGDLRPINPAQPPAGSTALPPKPFGETAEARLVRVLDTERMDAEFKGAGHSIQDVLSFIAAKNGINIAVDDSVALVASSTTIEITFKDVFVRDAILKTIASAEDLTIVVRGSAVVVVHR